MFRQALRGISLHVVTFDHETCRCPQNIVYAVCTIVDALRLITVGCNRRDKYTIPNKIKGLTDRLYLIRVHLHESLQRMVGVAGECSQLVYDLNELW